MCPSSSKVNITKVNVFIILSSEEPFILLVNKMCPKTHETFNFSRDATQFW